MSPYLLILVAGFFGFFVGAGFMMFILLRSANEEARWNEANRRFTRTMTDAHLAISKLKEKHQPASGTNIKS